MTKPSRARKPAPLITILSDGPGWWRYVVTLNGVFLLDGWVAGTRTDAKKDAAYRLKEWQAAQRQEATA